MVTFSEDHEWKARWEERGMAVRQVLGETVPPGHVTSFSWKEYILPGACALTFKPTPPRDDFLYMTLGLTQPLDDTPQPYPWEFSVRTNELDEWPCDLLYQLVTQYMWEKGEVGFGSYLPFIFFKDPNGKLWSGLTEDVSEFNVVGAMRGLYLWTDERRLRFEASPGTFSLLTVVAVTEDEDQLANATTPAHLMLLLRRMGIRQVCDPFRRSVLSLPDAKNVWSRIKALSHDDAFDELQQLPTLK